MSEPQLSSRPTPPSITARPRMYLDIVRFSHTLFALPFAVMSLFLAYDGRWPELRVGLIALWCMVWARTAAMAYNRLIDRDIDAKNPRTKSRHLPRGAVSVTEVRGLVIGASLAFIVGTWFLNPLAFGLSIPLLGVLLGYSHTKRFTSASHFVLGLALGLSPLGVWVAVRGLPVDSSYFVPALLGVAVLLWVTGFDILYSCQDATFDAEQGLHSIPSRIGIPRALLVSRLLHLCMVIALVGLAWLAQLGLFYWVGVVAVAALLIYEHRLVKEDDLSRIDVAFFTINGVISLLLSLLTVIEVMR